MLLSAPAGAQPATTAPGGELRIYLMTMGPGDAVWERFGHNALWVHDPVAGTDLAYNYGLFSFEQPGFVRRFLLGRMLYSMAPGDAELMVRAYAATNRSVWVQELNLTTAQKRELQQFLEWNALPENRDYLYDYYRDNCSTRIRDAIDLVLRGELRAALQAVPTGETFRSHSLRLTHDDLPTFTGLILAMGTPVDQPINAWEEAFIPMELSDHLGQVRVSADDGGLVPLASEPQTLFSAQREDPPRSAPRRTAGFLATGALIGLVLAALGHAASRGGRLARTSFAMAATFWAATVGVFGTVIALLWAVTDHGATYHNVNVLLAHPLSVVLAVLIPLAVLRGGAFRRAALILAAAGALLALLALALVGLGLHRQSNAEMLALLLPPHAALLWAVYSAARPRPSTLSDSRSARNAVRPPGRTG